MASVIIACQTLERELHTAMEQTGCAYPVIWLKAGDHNSPPNRRSQIEQALEQCGGCDTVLLAMGCCGGSVVGLEARGHTLVIPRYHDCITLLLGSRQRRDTCRDLYFLTEGWLRGEKSILREYRYCLEKYGPERTGRLFKNMFRHYRGIGFLEVEGLKAEDALRQAENFAAQLGLPLFRIQGTLAVLSSLLSGHWDPERFALIHPGEILSPELFSGGASDA